MEIKYKKLKHLIVLITSGIILSLGLTGLLFYQEKYKELASIFIIFGSLGFIFGLLMLFYRILYIYEANFDTKGISIKKRNKEIFIDYLDINDIEYERSSLIKYILYTVGSLYPGTLKINLKKREGKSYFIRMKHKDFENLPKKYKDLMK